MSDISKCPGEGCPLKASCKRFTAPSHSHWQAFMVEAWDGVKCDFYYEEKAQ